MLKGDRSFKNDVPFVSMIYEAAMISLNGGNSENGKYVCITVTGLGSTGIQGGFLPNPNGSDEVLKSNSKTLARLIVQICYAVWKINDNGFIHGDIHLNNFLVTGNPDNLTPLIIDFDRMQSLDYLRSTGYPLTGDMLNQSDPNSSKFLKFADDSDNLITSYKNALFFNCVVKMQHSMLTPEWQDTLSKYKNIYLVDVKYNTDMLKLFKSFDLLLTGYIDKGFISGNHKNIKNMREKIDSINDLLENKETLLSGQELFKKLNKASGLNLNDFNSVNVDLENYLGNVKLETNRKVARKMKTIDADRNSRIILV
jgi:hypothetical protein